MTDSQWNDLLRLIQGELLTPTPVGLIIDCPWLPGWRGVSILDYFNREQVWLEANLAAVRRFPEVIFLPGFWSEYGMCTEPSAFGAKCVFPENSFPGLVNNLHDYGEIARVKKPDCRSDGLLPFVLNRLRSCRPAIEKAGHKIRFAVARGPLNIASYLLGQTEFLVGVKTNPQEIHRLLRIVTDFLIDWIGLQMEAFDTIDGILLLDDLIGFLRGDDYREFALPYIKAVFASRRAAVKFLHNDASGLATAKSLAEMGVNLFNFSYNHGIEEIRSLAGNGVALVGNIPPRQVLAEGTPDDVRRSIAKMFAGVEDRRRIIVSCGGGAPPDAPTENIDALCAAAKANDEC
ncbi:MAG: uroporphyrinogen decarboxylase [Pirellulales bacterium]|nr:uroporphyrinogen decarboxylase [Pirellulales bacterium]